MVIKEIHFHGDGKPVDSVEICCCCGKRIDPQETLCKVGKKHYCLFCYEKTEGVDKE